MILHTETDCTIEMQKLNYIVSHLFISVIFLEDVQRRPVRDPDAASDVQRRGESQVMWRWADAT